MKTLPWSYLGKRPYQETWNLQEETRAKIHSTGEGDILFVVQHPPTLSLGRGEKGGNVLFPHDELQKRGFDVVETNRGGKVTYHGPGQLVAYPVINIKRFKMGVKNFVAALEETMIRCLGKVGIAAERREKFIGAWVDGKKIGSIGVHIRKQISIHGLAMNVETNLDHFNVITACGIDGVTLTSIQQEGVQMNVEQILDPFVAAFADVFGCDLEKVEIPFGQDV